MGASSGRSKSQPYTPAFRERAVQLALELGERCGASASPCATVL